MVCDSSSGRSTRRWLTLGACLLLGLVLGATCVVPPRSDRAVVAVSRFGSTTTLLSSGMSVSCLLLERRLVLPRAAGGAVIAFPVDLPQGGGASLVAELRLVLTGAGRLPVDAALVRASGWESAWTSWAAGALRPTADDASAVIRSAQLWGEIFPDAGTAQPPELLARLGPALSPLARRSATLTLSGGAEAVRAAARAELARRAGAHGRLVVLGLDALDWRLVDELVARGVMPNVARLLGRGVQAVDEIPQPLISPVVWTTLATGVPPDVHGVLDFLEPSPGGGAPRPVSAASRKAPALWEMAAAVGRSTAAIGWWATFPAQAPPRGAVYSDRLTEQLLGLSARIPGLADPPEAEKAAHTLAVAAPDVTPAMLAEFAPIGADELAAIRGGNVQWDDPAGGLAKLVAATLTVERLTQRELDRGTDLVLAYLEGTDTVGHLFAPFRPPAMPGTDPALVRRFGGVVDRYHAHVDGWIGRVVASLRPEDRLVIISDHGFTWGNERPRVPSGAHTATAVWWHRPEAVFIAAGAGIAHSTARERMQVLDVAPSLLALAGLPPASEMPGAAQPWLLERPTATPQTPARVDYAALVPPAPPARIELPPEAREEELAKLRALGYLAGGETTGRAPPPAQAGTTQLIPPPAAAPPAPAFDRAEARRLNNLGSSRASSGDKAGGEKAYRQAIAADPSYAASHYNLSLLLRKQDRFDAADKEFWQAVELGIGERELAVVQLALDYRERGQRERAKAVFDEGRRLFPDSAPIWLNSGVFLGEEGDLQQARACLERAVSLAPANPAGHRNLAAALAALGDRDGARHELAESLRLDPSQEQVRRQLNELGGPP